jgi:hypothetical protein
VITAECGVRGRQDKSGVSCAVYEKLTKQRIVLPCVLSDIGDTRVRSDDCSMSIWDCSLRLSAVELS